MNQAWSSLHIFYHDFRLHDRLVTDMLSPALFENQLHKRLLRRFFFIRYWEGGPHLRLRLQSVDSERLEALTNGIQETFESYLRTNPCPFQFEKEKFYMFHSMEGRSKEDIPAMPWYSNNSVLRLDYHPEFERYGGKVGVELAEDVFCHSSVWAMSLIPQFHSVSARLTAGLDAMVLFADFYGIDSAEKQVEFWTEYAENWLQLVPEERRATLARAAMDRCANAELVVARIGAVLDEWRTKGTYLGTNRNELAAISSACSRLAGWTHRQELSSQHIIGDGEVLSESRAKRILASYIHMHNNRLAVSPEEEAFLAMLLQHLWESNSLSNN